MGTPESLRIVLGTLATIFILFAGYIGYNYLGSRETPVRQMSFREQQKTVEAVPVEYKSREIAISQIGKVLAENAVDLIAEVQGEVLRGSIPLKQGQSFNSGQILFKVDDEEAKLSLYAQKSDFLTAIAEVLPDLKFDYPESYERWKTYFDEFEVEEAIPTLPEIKSSQEKLFFTTKNIINLYYNIKSAEERLSKYVVRAPFSGSFIEVLQERNSIVNPGARIARIAKSSSLELEVPVRTDVLSYVQQGTKVTVYSEDKRHTWNGAVRRVGAVVDETTQSVNIYVAFNPNGKQVFDGQYLQIEIPGTQLKDVMEIPRKALMNRNQVYVLSDSSRLDIKEVNIEKLNDETVLFSGLDEGELVVTEALVNVYKNMPVTVKNMNGRESVNSSGSASKVSNGNLAQ